MFEITKAIEEIRLKTLQLRFPVDAQEAFLSAMAKVVESKEASARFARVILQYEESEQCPYLQMIEEVEAIGRTLGIHAYTADMLMYLCMVDTLRARYEKRGIDGDVFAHTVADLSYKLEECRLVYGINGIFVAPWIKGFFDMTRFALGRLQFELIETEEAYTVGGEHFPIGSKAINVHIPRTGTRLDHGEVLSAYQAAADTFANAFEGQTRLFICSSWLLDPWNATVLSPTSNLALFYHDFKIARVCPYENYDEVWRLFDCLYKGRVEDLPQDSSLRRAYARRIERGEVTALGVGVFAYRDGAILND